MGRHLFDRGRLGLAFLEHFPADLAFGDFKQGDIRCAEASGFRNERTGRTTARDAVQLPNPARNDVHEDVRVSDFFQSFASKFSVQE